MIDIKFVNHIADKLKIERKDLIEKDILLQMLLNELVKNKEFQGIPKKKVRESISGKINKLAEIIEPIAKQLDLDFKIEKENKKYLQFGGSNAFVTFKIWYNSVTLNKPSFIKIQINFIENLNYPVA